jgi:hypothetical protein
VFQTHGRFEQQLRLRETQVDLAQRREACLGYCKEGGSLREA